MDIELWRQRFDDWLGHRPISPHTRQNHRQKIVHFLRFIEAMSPASWTEVHRDWIAEYRVQVLGARHERTDRPLTVGTQVCRLVAVKIFFRFLVSEGYLLANPATHLELPRYHRKLPPVLTEVEMLKLLAVPDTSRKAGLRDRAILELLYSTGLRNGELVALRLQDLDFAQQMVRVARGKGGKPRMVPMGEQAAQWLSAYLERVRPHWLRNPDCPAVFLDRWGQQALASAGLSVIVRQIGLRSQIGKAITPHLLRHSCATHMLRRGAGLRHIQELLGHNSVASTEHYTRVELSDLRKVLARCHPREQA